MAWKGQHRKWPDFVYQQAELNIYQRQPEGFIGGLSVKNYLSITGASRATATRDLQDLVEKNIFTRTGELKSTRYHLNIEGKQIALYKN